VRVDNDVTTGPVGTFLLVTGSNMAGKSTLLRTLGTNIVLAQAGAPVCAAAFSLPRLTLWTSMRPADSLAEGVSTFLAEVLRLKQVLEAAPDRESDGEALMCFLFDEIFQGTNTAERQIAARRVIRYLLARSSIGAVSTHDLTLAQSGDLAPFARCVHFKETIAAKDGRPTMEFDYLIRPGLATSTNAMRLMELVGLAVDSDEDVSPRSALEQGRPPEPGTGHGKTSIDPV